MKTQMKGSILLLLATVIWGSAFVSQSVGMVHVGPFTFQAARCALAVIAFLPVTVIADRFQKDSKTYMARWADPQLWKGGLLCGIPLFLACNLQQIGLMDTDPGKSGFLTAMYIVIVPLIGIFRGKRLSITVPVSVLLATAGLYFLSCVGVTQIQPGDLLTIGCALMFAVQITFVDIFAQGADAIRLNMIQAFVCAVLSAIMMLFTETPTWAALGQCVIPLVHTGVFSMGMGYYLQILGQRLLDTTPATLIMCLESVFAAIFGLIVLQQRMTGWEILGCILMLAAVILSQLNIPQKQS